MNWANAVTFGRIALIPVFVYLMYAGQTRAADPAEAVGPWLAIVVFAVAAATDSLDGYLARRHERVTPFGQFLDPLADKLLVGAALVTLVGLRGFPLWAAMVIVVREVAVSMLRTGALRRGRSLPASKLGKIKTLVQVPTVILWLFQRGGWMSLAQDAALYAAIALTVVSGARYIARARELLRPPGVTTG